MGICGSSTPALSTQVFEFADPTDLTTFVQRNLPCLAHAPTLVRGLSFDGDGSYVDLRTVLSTKYSSSPTPTDLTTFVRRALPATLTFPTRHVVRCGDGHMWIVDSTSSGDEVFEFADPTDLTTFVRARPALPRSLVPDRPIVQCGDGHMWIADTDGDEVFEFADPTDLTTFVRRALPCHAHKIPLGISFDGRRFINRPYRRRRSRHRRVRCSGCRCYPHRRARHRHCRLRPSPACGPPIVLAVFLADISGNFLTGSSNNVDPIEGEIEVSPTLTFGRIERRSRQHHQAVPGLADRQTLPATYFDDPGSPLYPTAKMYIQTAAGGRAEYDSWERRKQRQLLPGQR